MNEPLISVIIPTYNREHLILNAINSVLRQSFQDWDLIVVDDASTDNTAQVLNKLEDNRIKYVRSDINGGNAYARNIGVKKAKGKFISFLDSDDVMEPECLQEFYLLIKEKPDTNFAFGGYYIFNTVTQQKTKVLWRPDRKKSFLKDLRIGTGCGLLVKTEVFDEIGYFDERLRVAVDTDWLIRLENRYSYEVIEKFLITIFTHPGERVRNDKSELLNSYNIIFKKNKEEIIKDKELLYKFLYKLQFLNYQCKNYGQGNHYFKYQIKNGIIKLKAFITLLIYNLLPLKKARKFHEKISVVTN